LIELIDEDENLLVVAPRRIGKTSLLRESLRILNSRGRDFCVFVDLQHCSAPEEVIVSLALATKPISGLWTRALESFKIALGEFWDRVESVGIDVLELRLREGSAEAWQIRGRQMLANLAKAERPVVIYLDELPIVINRMMRGTDRRLNPHGIANADLFLSWLRQSATEHQGRIRFVVCGSIGLEPVLHQGGLSQTVTHLRPFPLNSWNREVADGCLSALANSYGLVCDPDTRANMLDHLAEFYVPHHVQMYFGHVLDDCRRHGSNRVTVADTERVYSELMLGTRGHAELADYEERLLRVIGPDLTPVALDLLTEAAVVGTLQPSAMARIVRDLQKNSYDEASALRDLLGILQHDGYLEQVPEQNGAFRFVSKLLRDWWQRRFGNGYIPAGKRGA
jgi:hypothetical protein